MLPSHELLRDLTRVELNTLSLQEVHLEHRQELCDAPRQAITDVFFLLNAVVSVVVTLSDGGMIETAMLGRDGIIGAAAALDGDIAFCSALVAVPGHALKCSVEALGRVLAVDSRRRDLVRRHEQALLAQTQQRAACAATHEAQARLAAWLLRVSDLRGGPSFHVKQDYIAQMLGLRRTTVSLVAHEMQCRGVLRYARGHIHVADRDALHGMACECYDVITQQHARLLGSWTGAS